MRALPSILPGGALLAALLAASAGCHASWPLLVDNELPRDYRFRFVDGSYIQGAAELHALVRFGTGEELWIHLRATNGELAAAAAKHWSQELNRMRPATSEASSNTFTIRHVLRIELVTTLRGLKMTEIGPSP